MTNHFSIKYCNWFGLEIRKVRKGFDKHGSSDESGGEDAHHFKQSFAHHGRDLAFKDDVFSGLNRERKTNIKYDGGEMPNYAYPGSESSEHDQSFDKTEDHETTEESRQQSPKVDDELMKDQTLEGYQEDDERQYRSDGNMSKTYDPVTVSKRPMVQGNTLIKVNHLVWVELPEHEHIMWERPGEIERVKGTSPNSLRRSPEMFRKQSKMLT